MFYFRDETNLFIIFVFDAMKNKNNVTEIMLYCIKLCYII